MRRYICGKCGKELASPQSLWNHKQRCDGGVGVKRAASIQQLYGGPSKSPKMDPLLDAIINDVVV